MTNRYISYNINPNNNYIGDKIQTSKLFEIISSYNQFWTTRCVEAGIKRALLPACLEQLDSKEVVVLKGVRRCGKSTLMAIDTGFAIVKCIPVVKYLLGLYK